jgi:RibD C-terminal domain
VHGSGTLVRWLLANELVDELMLLIVPVILGQGTRLFPQAGPDIALELLETRTDSKGVTIQSYRPKGRPQYPPTPKPLTATPQSRDSTEDDRHDAAPGFRDRRQAQLGHPGRDGCDRRVQRPASGRGARGLRRRLGSPDAATVIDNRVDQRGPGGPWPRQPI